MNKEFMIRDLLQTDKLFCEECKLDKDKAWIKYLSKDSIMISDKQKENIVGKENVSKVIKNIFSLKNISFIWKPDFADVSNDLSLGFTTGSYIKKYYQDKELIVQEGKYLTIWKKENGSWKIKVDMGN